MTLLIIFSLVSLGFLILVCIQERRRLLSGFALLIFLASLVAMMVALPFQTSQGFYPFQYPLMMLGITALIILIAIPIVITLASLYSGITMLKKAKPRLSNLLALALGIGMVIFFLVQALINPFRSHPLTYLGLYLTLLMLYFIFLLLGASLANLINLINLGAHKVDYIIVLGAALKGRKLSPVLKDRMDLGIKLYRKYAGSRLILSGGQGEDEVISEAQAMADYAIDQGLPEEDLILEDQSTNTAENIKFSKALVPDGSHFAIATNAFHVLRSLIYTRLEGMKAIGFGTQNSLYYNINAFLREFLGYLRIHRQVHLRNLLILTFLYLLAVVARALYLGSP